MKTGPLSNIRDAISTTDLQDSYQSPNKNRTRDNQKSELENELENWKDAKIIRILVCTAKDYNKDATVAKYLKSEKKTSDHNELFFLCDKEHRGDLFGETFARLAEAMTRESGEATFEDVIKKRGRDEEDTERNRKRPKT